MRVHILQHVPFEGLGSIDAWLSDRAAEVSWSRFYEAGGLPSLADIDLIIALGGPMSANDEDQFPWLRQEKTFLADAIARNKAVLGLCLGAQLIASALGSKVYPAAAKEIGWFPVFAEKSPADAFVFPAEITVFHWHGETFDLPAGAILLARSSVCRNQAFQVGPRVLGLQFHLETTPESSADMIRNCANELIPQTGVQSAAVLRGAPQLRYVHINTLMGKVLDYLADGPESLR